MNTNRKLTTLLAALLLLAATAASADTYTSTSSKIREVPDHHRLEVEIWTDRGDGARYRAGDSIEVFFRTNADAWVAIYDLDTRGRVNKLFPSRHAASNFVRGGVINRVRSRYGHHFEVEGPAGWETLRAVASTHRYALQNYRWNDDRWDERDRRYDDRRDSDRRYDDRDYDDRYRATSSKVRSVPDRIREVPDGPRYSPVLVIDETRHYVRDGYRPPRRPSRPWWHRR